MSSITYVFHSHSIALTALATVSAIHDLCLSASLAGLGAPPSLCCCQMVRTHSQVLHLPNNSVAEIKDSTRPPLTPFTPDPTLSESEKVVTHPLIVLQPKATMQTRITYHHRWEKLGLTISETLLLKYRE